MSRVLELVDQQPGEAAGDSTSDERMVSKDSPRIIEDHMPVVILTGSGDIGVAVQAMRAGAVNFIEKPYEKEMLLGAIDEAHA
jgi:FixJ family two-component response regulator